MLNFSIFPKRIVFCSLPLFVIFFLILCPPVFPRDIRIGVILPLTGPLSDIGFRAMNGLELAVRKVNSEGGIQSLRGRLTLYVQDIETNPSNIYRAVQRLVFEKVPIIIGTGSSSMTILASEITSKYQIPFIDCASTLPKYIMKKFPETFTLIGSPTTLIEGFAELMAGAEVLFAYENTKWGLEIKDSIKRKMQIVDEISIPYGGKETFYGIAESIKKHRDRTMMVATDEHVGLAMAKWCKEKDIIPEGGWINMAPVNDLSWYSRHSKYLPKGVLIASMYSQFLPVEGNLEFNEDFRKEYSNYPDSVAAMNWNCIWMLKDVLERARSLDPREIISSIRMTDLKVGMKNILLTDGIRFDETGTNILYFPQIIQIQNKQFKIVWPKKYQTGNYIPFSKLR